MRSSAIGFSRLGLFINAAAKEGAICAFDLVRHVRGMGHSMSLYAPRIHNSADSSLWKPFVETDLNDAGWWRIQHLDLAIFYGMGTFSSLALRQARQSGATVIIECDSDGTVSPLQSPLRRLRLAHMDSRLPFLTRLRSGKAWLANWILHGRSRERVILSAFSEADYIKVESEGPASILKRFLLKRGRGDLVKKVIVIPFAVRECFSASIIPSQKKPTVLLAGRLAAHQKGPVETLDVLRRLSEFAAPAQIEMHIRGDAPEFDALAARYPTVSVYHDSPQAFLAARMREAQIAFSRSRWETTPVFGLEALCSGCTLLAPNDLPGYTSLIQGDRFGTSYPRGCTESAIAAVRTELSNWREGKRCLTTIASNWREQCSLDSVVRRILQLQPLSARHATATP